MSMYIEMWSNDVSIHGDGVQTEAKFNAIGWPFNLDLSEASKTDISAEGMVTAGPPEVMMDLECEHDGSFITIRFPEPVPDRESMVVRLRVKVFV